ncbi:RWD-domain-containing protein [Rickenella mellea]|uniref:RWD-domain-containing protein n=1 Tax=Rickenella mellea TaxID=50990 RepID=A0A4Y7QJP9_9AGAM|nr:RWD-domain-containing protein [Rickenella mellea]
MSKEILEEEFEVLDSIYPTELTKLSEREIQIDVEPEELTDGEPGIKVTLTVRYTNSYPDAVPELSLEPLEGEIDDGEIEYLVKQINTVGEENLGMAMTFTLVSHLREQLSTLVKTRAELGQKAAYEIERRALEEEEARTRGTPVTAKSFVDWKAKFEKEVALKKALEDDEKLKNLSGKEREEFRKITSRLTGRQLFEKDKNLAVSDDSLIEEGTESVDVSQYDRSKVTMDEDEEVVALQYSDSD